MVSMPNNNKHTIAVAVDEEEMESELAYEDQEVTPVHCSFFP
jgi:hypothetical protein